MTTQNDHTASSDSTNSPASGNQSNPAEWQDWNDDEIVRTPIPERKRSGFDRVSFVAELKKNKPVESGRFMMGMSKSNNAAEFGKRSHSKRKASNPANREPISHTQMRGIHHGAPLKVYLGAFITALFYFSIFLLFIDILIISLTFEMGIRDFFVLGFLLLTTLLFVTFARSCRCGICKASFFLAGKLNRHARSHSLPFLGRNLPTALHALLLFWLRCPACGTPTRLIGKKGK